MTALVATRPERTAREIAADRKEANAFWARLERYNPTGASSVHRDIRRMLAREQFSSRLLMATKDGAGWCESHPGPQQRAKDPGYRARHFHRFREDSQLKPYVSAATRALMPPPQLTQRTDAEKKRSAAAAREYWRTRRDTISPRILARLDRDRMPFEHWLLQHWNYGPVAPGAPEPSTPSWTHLKKGDVRPAGMTPERALQIALAFQPK